MATREKINELADISESPLMFLEPERYDEAIVGVAEMFGGTITVAYDRMRVIEILMHQDGMDRDEAEEFFSFNIIGSYVGEGTPIYIDTRYAE